MGMNSVIFSPCVLKCTPKSTPTPTKKQSRGSFFEKTTRGIVYVVKNWGFGEDGDDVT